MRQTLSEELAEEFPMKQIIEAYRGTKYVVSGTFNLIVRRKPLTLTITWTVLGWILLALATSGLVLTTGGPKPTNFDREMIAGRSTRGNNIAAILRAHMPAQANMEQTKRALSERGFEPHPMGIFHIYSAETPPGNVDPFMKKYLEKKRQDYNASAIHAMWRIIPRGNGTAYVWIAERANGSVEVFGTMSPPPTGL